MSLSSFFHHGGAKGGRLCKWEIRLENDYTFLRGGERETGPFKIKGSVILMTSETIQKKGMRILLQGKRRTMHFIVDEREKPPGIGANNPIVNKATFLQLEQKLGDDATTVLKPGNYEFPFEFEMAGSTSESVEGLNGNFITYGLKAIVDRGVLAKDLVTRKHLRIIRTLGDDPLELVDPQDVNGLWPDKLKYQFSTASRAAIFGTHLTTDIEFTPLIEKLRIGRIRITLKETRKVKTTPGPDYTPGEGWTGMWKTEIPIKEMHMEIPAGSEDEDPQLHLPMYKFKSHFELPKSLATCRQSVESNEWIRIKHSIHYEVLLHNPDGHMSELRAHHGIRLFISPNLPVGDNNQVHETAGSSDATSNMLNDMQTAPPDYGHHRLDPLYDDIDPSGYMTPGLVSGANTPGFGLSVASSSEDLTSLNTIANSGVPHSQDLRRRLEGVLEGDNTNRRVQNGHSPPSTGPHSGTPSRSHSHFELASLANGSRVGSTPHLKDYDMNALRQVPSYDTAVRTPVRTPYSEVPPPFETDGSGMGTSPEPGIELPHPTHLRGAGNAGQVRF